MAVHTIQDRKIQEKKVKGKEKVKVNQEEQEEHSSVNNGNRNQNCGQKKTVLVGSKENEVRKAFRKAMRAFGRVDFALAHHKRYQAVIMTLTKVRARIKKEKTRNVPFNNQDFQHLTIRSKRDKFIPQNRSIGIPIALMIPPIQLAEAPLRGTIQDTLHGSHQFLWISTTIRRALFFDLDCTQSIASKSAIWRFQKYALYHDKTTEFCPCNKSFVFANSETETCRESCMINFPTTPPCSTRVDVLEPGDLPFLFSLLRMGNLGKTIELDSKGDKITCPAFALYSSPVEYSTMGHSVLDLTSLAYQPKSRERSARPTKHVTFALMPQKSAYTARSQEMDDDEDDKPLFRSDPTTVSEDEDDKPVVQPASRSETVKREPAAIRGVPTPLRRRKGPPIWRDPSGETGTGRVMNFA